MTQDSVTVCVEGTGVCEGGGFTCTYVPNSTKIRLKTNAHNYIVHGFYINFICIHACTTVLLKLRSILAIFTLNLQVQL